MFFDKIKNLFQSFKAKQITIHELLDELTNFSHKSQEVNVIGIVSNEFDCLYFLKNNGYFDFEYEVINAEQIPYLEELKKFANKYGFGTKIHSYGMKTNFYPYKDANVLTIFTKSDARNAAKLAKEIQLEIFKNSDSTKFDIVP